MGIAEIPLIHPDRARIGVATISMLGMRSAMTLNKMSISKRAKFAPMQ
jgi:hypothetical protein